MNYSQTLSLQCPHCDTKCQFQQVDPSHKYCVSDELPHIAYICTHCQGVIVTTWSATTKEVVQFRLNSAHYNAHLSAYYPLVGEWSSQVQLSLITNNEVRADFEEAINCYNNGFYNACMIMARRSIQQEVGMVIEENKQVDLYHQIESSEISKRLKTLLHKVRNFGNYGAHPDFCLFDEKGDLRYMELTLKVIRLLKIKRTLDFQQVKCLVQVVLNLIIMEEHYSMNLKEKILS